MPETAEEPATRNAERTRRALLDASSRAITTHGSAVTLNEIAAEAGVSKSGLLHHFPNKNALMLAVVEDTLDTFRKEVMRFLDLSENHPGKVLRAYVRALCGGSETAMNLFAHSGLWNTLIAIPGVSDVVRLDDIQWDHDLAADGLNPDRIIVVRYAVEGLATAVFYNPSLTEDTLARAQQTLIMLTENNEPISPQG